MITGNLRFLYGLAFAIAASSSAQPGRAETPAKPALVITIHARPADRTALRRSLENGLVPALAQWRASGQLAGYRLMFSRYADSAGWDAVEVLDFADEASLAAWRKVERANPGGLAPEAIALATAIETTPVSRVRNGGTASVDPAILVIPYLAQVAPGPYLQYLDGYTIPQFAGWIGEGVLDGYEIVTSRFPAGRDWSALIVLRYHDDQALGRRDEVVARVRTRLAADPTWKAISDAKQSVRTEKVLTQADQLAAAEPAP